MTECLSYGSSASAFTQLRSCVGYASHRAMRGSYADCLDWRAQKSTLTAPVCWKALTAAGRRTVLSVLGLAAIQGIERNKDAADLVR